MAEEFSQSVLIKVVAQVCQMVGFQKITTTSLAVLVDILKRFIRKLGQVSLQYGEHCGHSVISLKDLSFAFHHCGVFPAELNEFLELVSPLPKRLTVPKFPVTIQNPNTQLDSSDVDNLIEIENFQPDIVENVGPRPDKEDFHYSRETLKIKISLSKMKEAFEAKKSKNKKTKQKSKKKKSKKNSN